MYSRTISDIQEREREWWQFGPKKREYIDTEYVKYMSHVCGETLGPKA